VLAWSWLWRHGGIPMQPQFAFLFVMWWIMMVAMMLPSAAPMILLFAGMSENQREQGKPYVPTAVFASTYLVIWGAFSVVAASLQWWIETRIEPVAAAGISSRTLAGAVLLAAGAYQLTPLKHACLRRCRSPLNFVMTRWRPGLRGALQMGIEHGAYCVGCCWLLMGLLFIGGVMNLWWVIGVALYVLLEKVVPAGAWFGRALGAILGVAGVLLVLGATFTS
jgi:predicted metal-binding membrane protein